MSFGILAVASTAAPIGLSTFNSPAWHYVPAPPLPSLVCKQLEATGICHLSLASSVRLGTLSLCQWPGPLASLDIDGASYRTYMEAIHATGLLLSSSINALLAQGPLLRLCMTSSAYTHLHLIV